MTCEEIKKLLTKYVQHTADEEEIKKVEEHLCVCHDCRTSLGSLMDKLDESEEVQSVDNQKDKEENE
ncbi:MAG: zf-HC2 domain-containing protein, partial [Candidatus Omnitrophica bacterium]|nr:zf-HC2 domain-containing protein [Candidatus Omnitrophota bacterium]